MSGTLRAVRRELSVIFPIFAIAVAAGVAISFGNLVAAGAISLPAVVELFRAAHRRSPVGLLAFVWGFNVLQTTFVYLAGGALGQLLGFTDEGFVLALGVVMILERTPISRPIAVAAGFGGGIYVFAGVVGAVLDSAPALPMVLGTFAALKFWILLLYAGTIHWRTELPRFERVVQVLFLYIVAIAALNLGLPSVHDAIFNFPSDELERVGRESIRGPFTRPNFLAHVAVFTGLFWLGRLLNGDKARYLAMFVAALAMCLLTFRLKVAMEIAAVSLAVAAVSGRIFLQRLAIPLLAGLAVVVLFVPAFVDAIDQQVGRFVFDEEYNSRDVLYDTSAAIASDHAPFGVGFGRFGSGPSKNYYSSVYREYGIHNAPGIREDRGAQTVQDAAWATIFGEAGYLGLVPYAAAIIYLLYRSFLAAKANQGRSWAVLFGWIAAVAVITESSGTLTFFSSMMATNLAVAFAVALSESDPPPAPAPQPMVRHGFSAGRHRSLRRAATR